MAIGSFPNKVHSGFLVGLFGIILVLASITCGLGVTSFFDIGILIMTSKVYH
jgi:hypothetical protein